MSTSDSSQAANIDRLLSLINSAARSAVAEYNKVGPGPPPLDSMQSHPIDVQEDVLQLKKAIRLLEATCDQLCATLAPPQHTMMNVKWACILVVIETGIVDAVDKYPEGAHVDDLAKDVNMDAGKLGRVLRLLATRNCFVEVDTNVFANNRLSLQLHSGNPVSDLAHCHVTLTPKAATVLCDNLTQDPYRLSYEFSKAPFMHSVQDEGLTGGFFDWMKAHPEKRSMFGRAMIGMGKVMGSSNVLYHYDWNRVSTICDVGSGIGTFAMPFSRMFPKATITLIDLPGPIAQAKEFWAKDYPEAVAEGRSVFVEGDFFVNIPVEDQQVYYVPNILHNWPDAEAANILKTVRKAMGTDSRVILRSSLSAVRLAVTILIATVSQTNTWFST
ncbi:Multifunctional cyclase-dehydratase-3-O-methyl transferase TcmN [Leucoagaricus sp. SymC.cos]|nr:Multifunctional cyclase-dehydratase-3-O-methyl transferase TcmN [Leucoagaricus sp. SymC.cos]